MKKNVLITGIHSKLGSALAEQFFLNGYNVFGITKTYASNNNYTYIYVDNYTVDQIEMLTLQFQIDILINNAALLIQETINNLKYESTKEMFESNFYFPLFLIKKILDENKLNPYAQIINISSQGAIPNVFTNSNIISYIASKAALNKIAETLAEELAINNFTINTFALGSFDSPMLKKAHTKVKSQNSAETYASHIFNFLNSNIQHNSFITGKTIHLSGNSI
jgi:short-subunit dehydrogenase